jgi:hypothetical protein
MATQVVTTETPFSATQAAINALGDLIWSVPSLVVEPAIFDALYALYDQMIDTADFDPKCNDVMADVVELRTRVQGRIDVLRTKAKARAQVLYAQADKVGAVETMMVLASTMLALDMVINKARLPELESAEWKRSHEMARKHSLRSIDRALDMVADDIAGYEKRMSCQHFGVGTTVSLLDAARFRPN